MILERNTPRTGVKRSQHRTTVHSVTYKENKENKNKQTRSTGCTKTNTETEKILELHHQYVDQARHTANNIVFRVVQIKIEKVGNLRNALQEEKKKSMRSF